jgi:hypothetical protein
MAELTQGFSHFLIRRRFFVLHSRLRSSTNIAHLLGKGDVSSKQRLAKAGAVMDNLEEKQPVNRCSKDIQFCQSFR